MGVLEGYLPSWERAWALCEAYTENLSWYFRSIERAQIVEELFPMVYKRGSSSDTVQKQATPHDLALLFMVFAVGAVGDLTLPPDNDEGELYHQLARAALGLKTVFDSPSLATVQALSLMGVFYVFSGRNRTLETAWLTMNFALNLALSVSVGIVLHSWLP